MHQITSPVKVHWVKPGTYLYHFRSKDENTTRGMLDVVLWQKFWKVKTGNVTTSWRSSVSIHCRTNSTFKMFLNTFQTKQLFLPCSLQNVDLGSAGTYENRTRTTTYLLYMFKVLAPFSAFVTCMLWKLQINLLVDYTSWISVRSTGLRSRAGVLFSITLWVLFFNLRITWFHELKGRTILALFQRKLA